MGRSTSRGNVYAPVLIRETAEVFGERAEVGMREVTQRDDVDDLDFHILCLWVLGRAFPLE